jgi:hypothetical protein
MINKSLKEPPSMAALKLGGAIHHITRHYCNFVNMDVVMTLR